MTPGPVRLFGRGGLLFRFAMRRICASGAVNEILALSARRGGLPPLARRARRRVRTGPPLRRFTSAHAESTGARPGRASTAPVHLCSRGEHVEYVITMRADGGSSPLARRAQRPAGRPPAGLWFTSARAESTTPARAGPATSPVHLRSRGEHRHHTHCPVRSTGSPPLARRVPSQPRPGGRQPRFTSARAESTSATPVPPESVTVHLR